MRIIENPNPAKETIMVCSDCQCKFAYTDRDLHVNQGSNGVLGPGHLYWRHVTIECPNCGRNYLLDDKYLNQESSKEDAQKSESIGIGIEELLTQRR